MVLCPPPRVINHIAHRASINLDKSGQPSLKLLIRRQGYRPQAGVFYEYLTKI